MHPNRESEDLFLRNLLENNPGFIDENDLTPIAFDKNFKWYNAKELKEYHAIKERQVE